MMVPRPVALLAIGVMAVAECAGVPGPAEEQPLDPFTVRKLPVELEGDVALVVEANTRFALDLYAELRSAPDNLFFSPFSISTALAMTYAGTAGTTRTEMEQVLHFSALENLHAVYGEVLKSLGRGIGLGGYRLELANRLWGQSGARILPAFLAITGDHYQAGFNSVDFIHDSEQARQAINAWVEEKTSGRIEDLFPPDTVNPYTRLVLANAIYFKGKWASQFDPAVTRSGGFHVDAERTVDVPMMTQTAVFKYWQDEDGSVLEMPYRGGDLSMVILLPNRVDGLANLEAALTYEKIEGWIDGLQEGQIIVTMPRFKMTSEYALNEILIRMGMPSAFSEAADLSAMTADPGWFIQAVRHKGFVEVNEEGTEAAAATGVSVGVVSVPPAFTANHPFLFLIRDRLTDSILFIGRVVDPSL